MIWTVMGTWDGSEFLLDEPLQLEPGTHVVISVKPLAEGRAGADSAEPSDWSARIDHDLYGPMLGGDDQP